MDSGFNHKGIISVAKQGRLQNSSLTDEGPLQKMWQDHLSFRWHQTLPHWAPSASSRKAEVHCVHPDGETSTAVRNGFDECVMQKCWTYAGTSKRQRENKATSLFFGKAPQRMPAEFWGLFFRVIYVYTHTYLYIYIVYTHAFLNFGSCLSVRSWY